MSQPSASQGSVNNNCDRGNRDKTRQGTKQDKASINKVANFCWQLGLPPIPPLHPLAWALQPANLLRLNHQRIS